MEKNFYLSLENGFHSLIFAKICLMSYLVKKNCYFNVTFVYKKGFNSVQPDIFWTDFSIIGTTKI